jgi:hypothetical protein
MRSSLCASREISAGDGTLLAVAQESQEQTSASGVGPATPRVYSRANQGASRESKCPEARRRQLPTGLPFCPRYCRQQRNAQPRHRVTSQMPNPTLTVCMGVFREEPQGGPSCSSGPPFCATSPSWPVRRALLSVPLADCDPVSSDHERPNCESLTERASV